MPAPAEGGKPRRERPPPKKKKKLTSTKNQLRSIERLLSKVRAPALDALRMRRTAAQTAALSGAWRARR